MKKDVSKTSITPNCAGIPSKTEISECRGMSDPFFFSFNILKEKSHLMVAHGVVFTSLVLHADTKIELLTEDRDPRVSELLKFIWHNFLKDKKNDFLKQMADIDKKYAEEIKQLKDKLNLK